MGRRGGFFAELQRQARLADQRRRREATAQARNLAAAKRRAEQAQRAAERGHQTALRATAAEQKRADTEAKRLHEESMVAQAESMSSEVAGRLDEIDGILSATLDVDDLVDLESLRVVAEHPPFDRPDLQTKVPPPAPVVAPPEPVFIPPEPPSGMSKLFSNRKYEELKARSWAEHQRRWQEWQNHIA